MRTAVVIRAHQTTQKLASSVSLMSGGETYDLFVAANETHEKIDTFFAVKLSHSTDILRPLGERNVSDFGIVHHSDVVFSFLRSSLPDYDFILLVEDDLHMPKGAATLDLLLAAIRDRSPAVDLVATDLRKAAPNWWWYQNGQRRFEEVHAIFFPLVGMSARAIDFVRQERLQEAEEGADLVFCEAFVPSTLAAAGGFEMVDANKLLPGLYERSTFKTDLPFLLEDLRWQSGAGMFHPVFSAAEFLEKRFKHAKDNWNFRGFMNDLEHAQRVIPAQLKIEYAARASAFIGLETMDRLARLEARLK